MSPRQEQFQWNNRDKMSLEWAQRKIKEVKGSYCAGSAVMNQASIH